MPAYKSTRKTKDGRQWYFVINYTTLTGEYKKYVSKYYKTKKEAELEESKMLLSKGYFNDEQITFSAAIEYFIKEKQTILKTRSLERVKDYLKKIDYYLGNIEIKLMTRTQYDQFRDEILNSDLSITTKNSIFTFVKSLINFANEHFDVYNPIPFKYKRLKDNRVRTMDFYTLDEFNQFASVIDDIRFKGFFNMLFYQGLRKGEANALTWKAIDFENNTISVYQSTSTKRQANGLNYIIEKPKTASSIRTIPMVDEVRQSLLNLYDYYSKFEEFDISWFCFGGIAPVPESTIDNAKKRFCKKADIRAIRIHDFRHSCASLIANNGGSIMLLSKFLGHSSTKQTLDRYSHLYASEMDSLIDKINKLT